LDTVQVLATQLAPQPLGHWSPLTAAGPVTILVQPGEPTVHDWTGSLVVVVAHVTRMKSGAEPVESAHDGTTVGPTVSVVQPLRPVQLDTGEVVSVAGLYHLL
jgi:hypothetical protein